MSNQYFCGFCRVPSSEENQLLRGDFACICYKCVGNCMTFIGQAMANKAGAAAAAEAEKLAQEASKAEDAEKPA